MKLAIFLLLVTVISVSYSEPQKVVRRIRFHINGNDGDSGVEPVQPKTKILRKIIINGGELGGKGSSKGSIGAGAAGGGGIQAEVKLLINLLVKLDKALAGNNTAEVSAITKQIVVVLKRIVVILPGPLKQLVTVLLSQLEKVPQLCAKGAKGSAKAIITQIHGTFRIILGGGAVGGHQHHHHHRRHSIKIQLKFILILITKLVEAAASGNVALVTKLVQTLDESIELILPKLPPTLQKLITSIITLVRKIPQLSKGGNQAGIKQIITQIQIILTKFAHSVKGGVKGGKGTEVTGSISIQGLLILFGKLQKAIASRNIQSVNLIIQQILSISKLLIKTLPAAAQKIIIRLIELLPKVPRLLVKGNTAGITSLITQIEISLTKIIGGHGSKGSKGTVIDSTISKQITILLTTLQTAITTGNTQLINTTIKQLILILKTLAAKSPYAIQQLIIVLIGKLQQIPGLWATGNKSGVLVIILLLKDTISKIVGGGGGVSNGGGTQNLNVIINLFIKLQTDLSSGNSSGAVVIIKQLISALQGIAVKLTGSNRSLILEIVQKLTSLTALVQSGQIQAALQVLQQILILVKQVLGGGIDSGGAKGLNFDIKIKILLVTLTQLKNAVANGQIEIAISIVAKLLISLRELSATLSPALQPTIQAIIQLVLQIQKILQSGKTTGISSIIVQIEILIQKALNGGDGAKGGKGGRINLTPKQILEIRTILTRIVGPKLAKVITDLVVTLVNGLLGKVPLHSLLKVVIRLVVNLLKSHGILAKILGGGNWNAANGKKGPDGKLKNLTPADQARLIAILSGPLGHDLATTVVKLIATLINGLLGKLSLQKVLHSVVKLLKLLLGSHSVIGKLIGSKSLLGGLLHGLLGRNGSKGSLPKGSGSQIQIIFDLLIKLDRAVSTPGQSQLVISIIRQLVAVLRELLPLLPPAAQKTILFIIQLLNGIPSLLQAGNIAGIHQSIQQIEVLLQQIIGGAKGAKGRKNLSHKEILEIEVILTNLVGPQLAKVLTGVVVTLVNGLLGRVPLSSLLKTVLKLVGNLLKTGGPLGKLLGGGHPKTAVGKGARCANGKLKNLSPANQARLIAILSRVLGPYTAKTVVNLVTTLANGLLCKLPLRQILNGVTGLVRKLAGPGTLLGGVLGPHGVGGLLNGLLGTGKPTPRQAALPSPKLKPLTHDERVDRLRPRYIA